MALCGLKLIFSSLKSIWTFSILFLLLLIFPQNLFGNKVVLRATGDIWLSDANQAERNSSSGKAERFKLKSIQEMAVVRFIIPNMKSGSGTSLKRVLTR